MNKPFDPTYINLEYIFNKIYEFINGIIAFFSGNASFFDSIKTLMGIISVILITVIFYCLIRLYELREERLKLLATFNTSGPVVSAENQKWGEVIKYINSSNPADWKLAIIEADLILDEMVLRMGYKGANLGERLKTVEEKNFTTLQNAWEAHKIRNRIAHEGSDFSVSRTEARRVIGLYESAFREFEYL